jgi:hypothetical protein
MLIEHRGARPTIDPTAWIAPNAVVSGAVRIGPGTRVLYGAVLRPAHVDSAAKLRVEDTREPAGSCPTQSVPSAHVSPESPPPPGAGIVPSKRPVRSRQRATVSSHVFLRCDVRALDHTGGSSPESGEAHPPALMQDESRRAALTAPSASSSSRRAHLSSPACVARHMERRRSDYRGRRTARLPPGAHPRRRG